jgi:NADPH2:quinone reductase
VSPTDPKAPVTATGWVASRLGAPTVALEIRAVEVGVPGPNQVRIATETFCLDFNDIDTIHGRYGLLKFEPPFVVGMAAAGVVDAAGPGAEAFLGRRIVGCTAGVQGGYAPPRCSTPRACN